MKTNKRTNGHTNEQINKHSDGTNERFETIATGINSLRECVFKRSKGTMEGAAECEHTAGTHIFNSSSGGRLLDCAENFMRLYRIVTQCAGH